MKCFIRSGGIALLSCVAAFVGVGCESSLQATVSSAEIPAFSDRPVVVETQLNDFTASTQANVALDVLPGGNIIAVWDSRRQQGGQYGVYARLLNARGEQLSPEMRINEYIYGHQTNPAVAAAPDGTIWFAWNTSEHGESGGAVVARRFDRHLEPIDGDVIVSESILGAQGRPGIAVNVRGEALIVWSTQAADSIYTSLRGRLLSADGRARNGELTFTDDGFAGYDDLPAVVRGADDGFVLTWARRAADVRTATDPYLVFSQALDADGRPRGEQITVNPRDGGVHIEPAIDSDAQGRFVIAWHASDHENHWIFTRRFDETGRPMDDARAVSAPDSSWMSGVAASLHDDGRALITWNHQNTRRELDMLGVVLDSSDRAIGSPFAVGVHADGEKMLQPASNVRRVAWCAANDVIAVGWSGDAGSGDSSAANLTLFHPATVRAEDADPSRLAARSQILARVDEDAPIPPIRQRRFELPPIEEEDGLVDFGFLGINFTGWTPPDPEIATGPDHVMIIVNGGILVRDKTGALMWQDDISGGGGFWGSVGATNFVFDPECLWDPHAERYWAMACERGSDNRSYFLLAVSATSDPTGAWHKWRIHRAIDNDIDSPNFAVDENVVYLSADYFGPDKYEVVMLEKAPLLNGSAITSETTVLFTGSGNQSMGMPIMYDAGAGPFYIIQSSEGTSNGLNFDEVRFHGIRNQLTNPTLTSIDVNVPMYQYPTSPPQAGTTVRPFLFEPRFWSCMYVNGSFWAVHHVNSTRTRVRWYEFEMNGWPNSGLNPTLRQWGEIDPDPSTNVHTFFPSIAADAEGNAVIFFSRSSPTEFISIGRSFRRGTDPLNTFRPMEFVKHSTSPYTAASRWGDYSHVEPDPSEPRVFWGHHEWTDVSNAWRTWIARVDTRPPAASITGFEVVFGSLISGTVNDLRESDGNEVVARSAFGFTAAEANLLRINIGYTAAQSGPSYLLATTDARLNNPGGTARLRLFNWTGGTFEQQDQWPIGMTNVLRETTVNTPGSYLDSEDTIRAQLQFAVVATFDVAGFEASIDQASIRSE